MDELGEGFSVVGGEIVMDKSKLDKSCDQCGNPATVKDYYGTFWCHECVVKDYRKQERDNIRSTFDDLHYHSPEHKRLIIKLMKKYLVTWTSK